MQKDKQLRINKLGLISLNVDKLVENYNDLHSRLINDWKPKIVQKIKDTKAEIEELITNLLELYKLNSVDTRASYIQILILKLKKAVSTQLELNIIMSPKQSSLNNSKLQSNFEEPTKIQSNEIKNRINKTAELQLKARKTPVKQLKKVATKLSPLKKQQIQGDKSRVIVNNLQKKAVCKPKNVGNYQTDQSSPLDKIGSARFNKKSDNFMRMEDLNNTQKLQNLMLTIKMTKQQYFQYMKDS